MLLRELVGFLLPQLPSGSLLLLAAILLALSALEKRFWPWISWTVWIRVPVAFLIFALSLNVFQGKILITEVRSPIIKKLEVIPQIVGIAETATVHIDAFDPQGTQLAYLYSTRGVGGRVPQGLTDRDVVSYVAPTTTGTAWVKVVAQSGGVRPRVSEAEASVRVVTRSESQFLNSILRKATSDLDMGHYAEALGGFSDLRKRDPGFAGAPLGQGISYAALGDWGNAASAYTAFTNQNPSNDLGYILRAHAYQQSGNADSANADIRQALVRTKDSSRKVLMKDFLSTSADDKRQTLLKQIISSTPAQGSFVPSIILGP